METLTSQKLLYRDHVCDLAAAVENFTDARLEAERAEFTRTYISYRQTSNGTNQTNKDELPAAKNSFLTKFKQALRKLERNGDLEAFKKVTELPAYIQDLVRQGDVHFDQVKPEDQVWLVFCQMLCGFGSKFCQAFFTENSHPLLKFDGKLYRLGFNRKYKSKAEAFSTWLDELPDIEFEFEFERQKECLEAAKDYVAKVFLTNWGWQEVEHAHLIASFANEPDGRYQLRDFVPVDLFVPGPAQPKLNTLKHQIATYDYRQVLQAIEGLRQYQDLAEDFADDPKTQEQAQEHAYQTLENYSQLASSAYNLLKQFEYFSLPNVGYFGESQILAQDVSAFFEAQNQAQNTLKPRQVLGQQGLAPDYLLFRFVDSQGFAQVTSAESELVSFEQDNLPYVVFAGKLYRRQFAAELSGRTQDHKQTFLTQLLFTPGSLDDASAGDNFYACAQMAPAHVHTWLTEHGWKQVGDGESLPSVQVLTRLEGKLETVTRTYSQAELELFRQLPDGRYARPPFYLGEQLYQLEIETLCGLVVEKLLDQQKQALHKDPSKSDQGALRHLPNQPVFFQGLTKQEILDEISCHQDETSEDNYRSFLFSYNSHPYLVLAGRLYRRSYVLPREFDVIEGKTQDPVSSQAAFWGWCLEVNYEVAKSAAFLPDGRYPQMYMHDLEPILEFFLKRGKESYDWPLVALPENMQLISPLSPLFPVVSISGEQLSIEDADGHSHFWRKFSKPGTDNDLRREVTSAIFKRFGDDLSIVLAQRGITEYQLLCDKSAAEEMDLLFAEGACYEDTRLPFLVYGQNVYRRRTQAEGQMLVVCEADFNDVSEEVLESLGWVKLPAALARMFSWNLLPDGRYQALDSYSIRDQLPGSIVKLVAESVTSSRTPINEEDYEEDYGDYDDDYDDDYYHEQKQKQKQDNSHAMKLWRSTSRLGCWNPLTLPNEIVDVFAADQDDDFF